MNKRVRELFEKHTLPNFAIGQDLNFNKNSRGEYSNPIYEDHWNTYQEAVETTVNECIQYLKDEIERLSIYGRTIPEENAYMRDDVDISIEKCLDNIQGIQEHFGINKK